MIERLPFEFLGHVINKVVSVWFLFLFINKIKLVGIAVGWLLNTENQLAILDYVEHHCSSSPLTDSSKKEMSKQIRTIPQSTPAPSLKAYAYPLHQAVPFLILCAMFIWVKSIKCHIFSLRFTDFNPVNRPRRLEIYTSRALCPAFKWHPWLQPQPAQHSYAPTQFSPRNDADNGFHAVLLKPTESIASRHHMTQNHLIIFFLLFIFLCGCLARNLVAPVSWWTDNMLWKRPFVAPEPPIARPASSVSTPFKSSPSPPSNTISPTSI